METDVAIRVSDSRAPPPLHLLLPPLFNFARVSLKASGGGEGLGGEVLENTAMAARSQVLRRIVKMKFLFIHGMRDSKWHSRAHKCSSRWIHFHARPRRRTRVVRKT